MPVTTVGSQFDSEYSIMMFMKFTTQKQQGGGGRGLRGTDARMARRALLSSFET